jgi:hypothetical protein
MRQAAIAGSVIVLVVGAAVLAVFLWLRTYAPLEATRPFAPGTGLGADVEPTFGSGGKTVLIPAAEAGKAFGVTVTLHNSGRFAVTLLGAEPSGGALGVTGLDDPVHDGRFRELRLDPHDSASVVIEWRLDCSAQTQQVSSDRVRLRYRYLSTFTRTAAVELPFAVTLRCSGGPPASP